MASGHPVCVCANQESCPGAETGIIDRVRELSDFYAGALFLWLTSIAVAMCRYNALYGLHSAAISQSPHSVSSVIGY